MDFLEAHPPYHSQDAPGNRTTLGVGLTIVMSRVKNMVILYRILQAREAFLRSLRAS